MVDWRGYDSAGRGRILLLLTVVVPYDRLAWNMSGHGWVFWSFLEHSNHRTYEFEMSLSEVSLQLIDCQPLASLYQDIKP